MQPVILFIHSIFSTIKNRYRVQATFDSGRFASERRYLFIQYR